MNKEHLAKLLEALSDARDALNSAAVWVGKAYEAAADDEGWAPDAPQSAIESQKRAQPATIPAPPVRTTWREVGMAYRERYLEAREGKVLDYHIRAHQQGFEDLSQVVDGYREPMESLLAALDAFFADRWAMRHDYPVGALVKGFGKYANPAPAPVEEEPDPEAINARRIAERRKKDEAELDRQLRGSKRGASKPPPLDELVGKIGREI